MNTAHAITADVHHEAETLPARSFVIVWRCVGRCSQSTELRWTVRVGGVSTAEAAIFDAAGEQTRTRITAHSVRANHDRDLQYLHVRVCDAEHEVFACTIDIRASPRLLYARTPLLETCGVAGGEADVPTLRVEPSPAPRAHQTQGSGLQRNAGPSRTIRPSDGKGM